MWRLGRGYGDERAFRATRECSGVWVCTLCEAFESNNDAFNGFGVCLWILVYVLGLFQTLSRLILTRCHKCTCPAFCRFLGTRGGRSMLHLQLEALQLEVLALYYPGLYESQ